MITFPAIELTFRSLHLKDFAFEFTVQHLAGCDRIQQILDSAFRQLSDDVHFTPIHLTVQRSKINFDLWRFTVDRPPKKRIQWANRVVFTAKSGKIVDYGCGLWTWADSLSTASQCRPLAGKIAASFGPIHLARTASVS